MCCESTKCEVNVDRASIRVVNESDSSRFFLNFYWALETVIELGAIARAQMSYSRTEHGLCLNILNLYNYFVTCILIELELHILSDEKTICSSFLRYVNKPVETNHQTQIECRVVWFDFQSYERTKRTLLICAFPCNP